MTPVLYGASYSAYVRVARLALSEKGVDYELVPVDVFESDSLTELFKRHPFGKVPAFEHGGFALYETSAICHYIDAAFGGPALQPNDPKSIARMAQVIGIVDSYLYRSLVWDVYVEEVVVPRQGGETNAETVARGKAMAETSLTALDAILDDQPFIAGPSISLADCHLLPMLEYGRDCQTGGTLVGAHPKLVGWVDRMTARPSWAAAITE